MNPLKAALAALILTACSADPGGPLLLAPTDLDAGDTTSTDLGTVAETGTTDAGDTTPEVVQPDARTDTDPDAQVDDVDDAAAEVSPPDTTPSPVVDQCTGPFDGDALTDRTALQSSMWACLVDCGRDVPAGEVEACTVACIDRGTELTPGCAGCFGELATCALDAGCFEDCEQEPDGWRCAYCQWTSCREGFEGCSGAEAWRTEEACEGGRGYRHSEGIACASTSAVIDGERTIEDCLEERFANNEEGESCDQCLIDYSLGVLEECDVCTEQSWCSTACNDCARASESAAGAVFCSGERPLFDVVCD